MNKSLIDQLKKSGLVNEQQAKIANNEKRKKSKNKSNKSKVSDVDGTQSLALDAQAEKIAKDKELNRKKVLAQKEKETVAQIKQLIDTHKVDHNSGEIRYNFSDDGKVRRIFINEAHRNQLSNGKLGIVKHEGLYFLVPFNVAEKISQRDESALMFLNTSTIHKKSDTDGTDDDYYADYQVPDDLIW